MERLKCVGMGVERVAGNNSLGRLWGEEKR